MISFNKPEFLQAAKKAMSPNVGRARIETIQEVPENVEGSALKAKEDKKVDDAASEGSWSSSDAESASRSQSKKSQRASAGDSASKKSKQKKEKKKKKKDKKKSKPGDDVELDQIMRDLNQQLYEWFDQNE